MDDLLPDIGDLLFTLLVGYLGGLECLYVVRHLYHWSLRHPHEGGNAAESLSDLEDSVRDQLAAAAERERNAGANAMRDGVLYKDGFRIDPQQAEIDKLKEQRRLKEEQDEKRKEIEAELARQKRIEEETRQQLQRAEAELARQRADAARADEAEAKANAQKLIEAERAREDAQRKAEEASVAAELERKAREQAEAEAQKRAESEREENERKLLEAERKREEEQRLSEEAEVQREAAVAAARLIEAERQREVEQMERDLEAQEAAEQSRLLLEAERERERKQKLIEENARKFLEAEMEMVELQQQMMGGIQRRQASAEMENEPEMPVVEEPIVRSSFSNLGDRSTPTVKTQGSNESYSLNSKPLIFASLSDDGSSIEPTSSQQSSFSSEINTGIEESKGEGEFAQLERQEPDGEDTTPGIQYSEDYLRSLDGIKHKPLMREDGSGRRRAFKKRRSSGSSTSSRDSRASREEELKMFTSLEEEEFRSGQSGENEHTPIKYTSEPTLRVKGHHRRHKRSPALDLKADDGSLEMLDEENTNPWGEGVPEHYKDTEFWKREKAMSIDEEEQELRKSPGREDASTANQPQTLSFEEASDTQNKAAISVLQNQLSKELSKEESEVAAGGDPSAQSNTSS